MKNGILIFFAISFSFLYDLNGQVTLKEVVLLYEGNTSLYSRTKTISGNRPNGPNGFIGTSGSYEYQRTEFYAKREGENLTKLYSVGLMGNGSGKKAMKKYFKDCPKLIGLIKNRAFEKYFENNPDLALWEKLNNRFIEIVKYYNTNCKKEN